jgi:hypothetical protein
MATLNYDEIKPRKSIVVDDIPYEILESHVARTQKRKPQNQVKQLNEQKTLLIISYIQIFNKWF